MISHFFIRLTESLIVWISAAFLATILRFDGTLPYSKLLPIVVLGILGGLVVTVLSFIFSLYYDREQRVTFQEVVASTTSYMFTTILLTLVRFIFEVPSLPRSVPIITGILALFLQYTGRMISARNSYRSLITNKGGKNTLIYGAGITGRHLIEQMVLNPKLFYPIGFIDDNLTKQNNRVFGKRIYGGIDNLEIIANKHGVKVLIVAISAIDSNSLLELKKRCQKLNLELKIIPNTFEILSKNLLLDDLSDVSEEDLLGRHPVHLDEGDIIKFIKGKRVLVTGAAGSIGSEIAIQVNRYSPQSLHLLDRDENGLLELELKLSGNGLLNTPGLLLADIRDKNVLSKILCDIKPDIVFHAAALKHLAMLENFPEEAYKTNVVGTNNLIQASLANDVKFFVNISTDKAADPISELGKSKLITERLISGVNKVGVKYISVRFGNVIGSKGSFLNTFRFLIKEGQTIKITHPEVSRYFMMVSEAVHLVLKSIVVGNNGETLILEMGNPIRITDVAQRMINSSGKNIKINFVGLRKGEKLHEVLIGENEKIEQRVNKDITQIRVPPISEAEISKYT